jgi:hypothetical protein
MFPLRDAPLAAVVRGHEEVRRLEIALDGPYGERVVLLPRMAHPKRELFASQLKTRAFGVRA